MSDKAQQAFAQGAGFAAGHLNIWLATLALAIVLLWVVWAIYGLFRSYTAGEINLYQFTTWGFGSLGLTVFLLFILV